VRAAGYRFRFDSATIALDADTTYTRALAALERGSLTLTPQPEAGVTYAAKIAKDETRIDWSKPANEVHNHIRGLSPFPGAWCELADDGARVKVRTKATLRAVPRNLGNRVRATFRGRVLGRFRPPGVRVELQGRRGRSYVTLATAAAKPDGSYRVTYRFTHSAHGRYVFRVRVRHYPRFPYFLGYSRAVNVFIR
jgi:hypothetical protein